MSVNWQKSTLAKLCVDVSYGYTESAQSDPVGPKFLRITDIQNGVVDWSSVPYCPIDARKLPNYLLKHGDIVIARTGNSTGENYIFDAAETAVFASYLIRYRINPEQANPFFIWYQLRTRAWWEYVAGSKTGSAQAGANAQVLGKFEVILPPRCIQDRIVDQLKTIDDKIKLNRQINQTLEQIAQTIFKSWFVDFEPVKAKLEAKAAGSEPEHAAMCAISGKTESELDQLPPEQYQQLSATAALFPDELVETELGLIPQGWDVSDFGTVSICYDKYRIPLSNREREKKKGSIPYYGATSVMDYVDEAIFDGVYLLLGEDGSVLKEDGTPFVQYIWGKSWVNNHAHVLQGANDVSTEQLMLFIAMQNISAYVTGAVQLKLNQKNMNSIPFVKAASEINESFSVLITPLYAQYRSLVEEIWILTELRNTLLPKLLSGDILLSAAEQQIAEV